MSVRRSLAAAVLVVAIAAYAALCLVTSKSVSAQGNQNSSSTPVSPNAGAIIGGPQANASPVPSPALECQGCHGPGKKLPYLAGSLFHTVPHAGYDHSFHA